MADEKIPLQAGQPQEVPDAPVETDATDYMASAHAAAGPDTGEAAGEATEAPAQAAAEAVEEFYEIRAPGGAEPQKLSRKEFDSITQSYQFGQVVMAAQAGDAKAKQALIDFLKLNPEGAKAAAAAAEAPKAPSEMDALRAELKEIKDKFAEQESKRSQAEMNAELDKLVGEHFPDFSDKDGVAAVKFLAAQLNANGGKDGLGKSMTFVKKMFDGYAARDKQKYVESKLVNGRKHMEGAGGIAGGKKAKAPEEMDFSELEKSARSIIFGDGQ